MRGRQTAGCQRCPLRKRFRSREHRACCRLRKKLSVITLSACLTRSKIVDSDAFRAFPFAPPCRALRRRRIINQILTFADLAIASSGLGTCFQHAWDDGRRPPGRAQRTSLGGALRELDGRDRIHPHCERRHHRLRPGVVQMPGKSVWTMVEASSSLGVGARYQHRWQQQFLPSPLVIQNDRQLKLPWRCV